MERITGPLLRMWRSPLPTPVCRAFGPLGPQGPTRTGIEGPDSADRSPVGGRSSERAGWSWSTSRLAGASLRHSRRRPEASPTAPDRTWWSGWLWAREPGGRSLCRIRWMCVRGAAGGAGCSATDQVYGVGGVLSCGDESPRVRGALTDAEEAADDDGQLTQRNVKRQAQCLCPIPPHRTRLSLPVVTSGLHGGPDDDLADVDTDGLLDRETDRGRDGGGRDGDLVALSDQRRRCLGARSLANSLGVGEPG